MLEYAQALLRKEKTTVLMGQLREGRLRNGCQEWEGDMHFVALSLVVAPNTLIFLKKNFPF